MAIKILTNIKNNKYFQKEISSLSKLKHENIIELLGWTSMLGCNAVLLEYMEGGSLDEGKQIYILCLC